MVKVLAFTKYTRLGASSRLRTYQYVDENELPSINWFVSPLLDDEYIDALYKKRKLGVFYLLKKYILRLFILLKVFRYDIVWIEKELFPGLPALAERTLSFFGVKYIVDYDDAIFHNYDLSPNYLKRLLRKKIDIVMRHSALVTAGNQYLADRAISAGSPWVEVLPTVIDINRYPMGYESVKPRILTIGWIGSPSTEKYLYLIFPILDKLVSIIDFQLIVIGAELKDLSRDYIHRIKWEEKTEVRNISEFDIGIMPLFDEPFERGKCGYKLIQYMACSKAVVASPIGVNCELVHDGVSGFLAANEEQWEKAFITLATDTSLCRNMGRIGRKLVEGKYCLQKTAPNLKAFVDRIVDN